VPGGWSRGERTTAVERVEPWRADDRRGAEGAAGSGTTGIGEMISNMSTDERGATRRRGAALEDALLQAAWDEVSDVGYAKFTMDGAAARAGTARSVLYRRWPSRAALVHAAIRHHLGSLADNVPDTGDLRQDVLGVLRRNRDSFQAVEPGIFHGLMAEAADLPEEVYQVTPDAVAAILERAAGRGEVRRDRITPRITALPGDLLRHEMLRAHGDPSDSFLASVVDEVFLPLVLVTPS
jgi:AcrR family transcriptional regulator